MWGLHRLRQGHRHLYHSPHRQQCRTTAARGNVRAPKAGKAFQMGTCQHSEQHCRRASSPARVAPSPASRTTGTGRRKCRRRRSASPRHRFCWPQNRMPIGNSGTDAGYAPGRATRRTSAQRAPRVNAMPKPADKTNSNASATFTAAPTALQQRKGIRMPIAKKQPRLARVIQGQTGRRKRMAAY